MDERSRKLQGVQQQEGQADTAGSKDGAAREDAVGAVKGDHTARDGGETRIQPFALVPPANITTTDWAIVLLNSAMKYARESLHKQFVSGDISFKAFQRSAYDIEQAYVAIMFAVESPEHNLEVRTRQESEDQGNCTCTAKQCASGRRE